MKYIKNFNNFVLEKKANVSEYPNTDFLGLVRKQFKRNSTSTISLTLFDFKEKEVIGYIKLDNLKDKKSFEVLRTYAKKDWGAVIYDLGLMDTDPLPLVPSKLIMPKAVNIWKYYYNLRSDVKKTPISPEDDNYSKTYQHFLEDSPKNDENLKYINCYYTMEKSNLYITLIEKGKFLLERYKLTVSFVSSLGEKEFENVYEY